MADNDYESINPLQINNNEHNNNLDDKYRNITNVSQLKKDLISQPEQNKFVIYYTFWVLNFFILFVPLVFFLIVLILKQISIYDEVGNEPIIYVLCIIIVLVLIICPFYTWKINIIFEETAVKIVFIRIGFCSYTPIIINYSEIKRFDIETTGYHRSIIFYDKDNEKYYLTRPLLYNLEEVEYFVYCANKYIRMSL